MVFMTYITLHRVPALSGILLRDGIYLPGGRQAGLVGAGYDIERCTLRLIMSNRQRQIHS